MADMSGVQKFLGEAADFFRTLIERIKKADRRLLIMIAAAVVLLIVIIALIAHGVSSGKETNEPVSVDTPALVQEQNTANEPANTVVKQNTAGNYRVTTSGVSLKLRPTASTSYDPLDQIPNGTELEVLYIDDSSSDSGWGYVEYKGQRGWVSMEYMTPVR